MFQKNVKLYVYWWTRGLSLLESSTLVISECVKLMKEVVFSYNFQDGTGIIRKITRILSKIQEILQKSSCFSYKTLLLY